MDVPRIVAVALLTSRRRVLVNRRPASGPLPGQWQFPGGKVDFGEHPWDALRRELREELKIRITHGTLYGIYSHVYEIGGLQAHYVLVAYHVAMPRARIRTSDDWRWGTVAELRRWPVLPGSKPIVADLAQRWPR